MNFLRRVSHNLDAMKRWCTVQDAEYWDLPKMLEMLPLDELVTHVTDSVCRTRWKGEKDEFSDEVLYFEFCDGFEVKMNFLLDTKGFPLCFMGFVRVPAWYPFTRNLLETKPFHRVFDVRTARRRTDRARYYEVYWTHDRVEDALLCQPAVEQPDRVVSGPVQVFQEAMDVIALLRVFEETQQRFEKVRQTFRLEEELIQRAWHPKRVKAWVEAGMEI